MNVFDLLKKGTEVPDFYSITIDFHSGKTEALKVVSHKYLGQFDALELHTKDDTFIVLPLAGIAKISFDKQFSKLVEAATKAQAPHG